MYICIPPLGESQSLCQQLARLSLLVASPASKIGRRQIERERTQLNRDASGPTVTNFYEVDTQPQVCVLTSFYALVKNEFGLRNELSDLKIVVTV